MRTLFRFLGTFDDPPTQAPAGGAVQQSATPPAAVPVAAPAVPEAVIPISQLQGLINPGVHPALQQVAGARPAAPPPVAAPAAAPPPPSDDHQGDEIAKLRKDMRALTNMIEAERLENYRLSAIQNYRSQGIELIDALVGGRTRQEIDASLQVAANEYNLIVNRERARIQAQVEAQLRTGTQPVVQAAPAAPAVPVGTVAAVAPPALPAAAPPAVPAAAPISSPSFLRVPGVPEGQGEITQEFIQYLTTPAAMRNGDYQKYRHLVHGALRAAMPGIPRGQAWSFSNHTQIAPPVPVSAPAPAFGPQIPQAGFHQPAVPPPYGGYQAPAPVSAHPAMFGHRPYHPFS